MRFRLLVFAFAVITTFLPFTQRVAALPNDIESVFSVQLETHTDSDSPDDYIYKTLSFTKRLEGRITGSVYFLHKHNLDTDKSGGYSTGVQIVRKNSESDIFLLGYSFTRNEDQSTRNSDIDKDRFKLGYYHVLHKDERNRLMGSVVLNTQTDWSETMTLTSGLRLKHRFSNTWSGFAGGALTYAFSTLDTHIYNEWNIKFNYRANDQLDLFFGFCFVDKTYSYASTSLSPDNDSIFRAGSSYNF